MGASVGKRGDHGVDEVRVCMDVTAALDGLKALIVIIALDRVEVPGSYGVMYLQCICADGEGTTYDLFRTFVDHHLEIETHKASNLIQHD
jgi:hypothetical protein